MATRLSETVPPASIPSEQKQQHPARIEKTIGFPNSESGQSGQRAGTRQENRPAAPMRSSRPAPKRPKGRWFITLFIAAIAIVTGSKIWNQFGQNQAYGIMQGRVLEIRAPWNGIIESLHVRDGQFVEQGQLLATINNFEFKNERLRLKHELEIALADLAMRVADVQTREKIQSDSALKLQVEYYQLLGRLHAERAKLQELDSQFHTNQWLYDKESISKVELDSNRIQLAGQKSVVDEIDNALEKLQSSLVRLGQRDDSILQPLVMQQTRIQAISAEFDRLSQLESMGEIRAPVQGLVIKRHQFTGEFIGKNTVVFEVLEHDSLEAVVYLPQSQANLFTVGDHVHLVLPPESQPKMFRIQSFGEQMVQAPESIERFYNAKQQLIPVHAIPQPGQLPEMQEAHGWWLGAEVRLPRFGYRPASKNSGFNFVQLKHVLGF
jgi:multidrug resistance efflux pump